MSEVNEKDKKAMLMEKMKEKSVRSVILAPSMNMAYMTGFTTFPGERLLVSIHTDGGKTVFIVPKLYEQEVREKGTFDALLSWGDSENPVTLLQQVFLEYDLCGTTAVEDTMWFCIFEKIAQAFEGVQFIKASEVIGSIRQLKSPAEIETMRKASELTENALAQTLGRIKSGMRETEVKEMLEAEMKKQGLACPSFDTIIGSGSNSALPHYTAGDRLLQPGDSIVIDFGGMYQGYCSDMTRTVFMGQAPEEFRTVYQTVKDANRKAAAAVKPGVRAAEIDDIARRHIEEAGYGSFFIHRTGHGIGMEVHEEPYISDRSETILEPGMVFSIEPGIYLPGRFGVRIEDLVVVTESGGESLNQFSKELIEILD